MVSTCIEKRANGGIPEQIDHRRRKAARLAVPAWLDRGLIERQQSVDEKAVILEVAVELGLPIFVGAEEAPAAPQPGQHEIGVLLGGADVVLASEGRSCLGERAQHQAVPGGQDLFVAPGLDALLADLEQRSPPALD